MSIRQKKTFESLTGIESMTSQTPFKIFNFDNFTESYRFRVNLMTTLKDLIMVTFTVYYIIIILDWVCYFLFQVILGKVVRFPTSLDEQLQKQLLDCSGEILTATGNTMCTHDFYEGKIMF